MSWKDRQAGEDDFDLRRYRKNEPQCDSFDDYECRRTQRDYDDGYRAAELREEERREEERGEQRRQEQRAWEEQEQRYYEEQEFYEREQQRLVEEDIP